MDIGAPELLIILMIVLLLFGVGRLAKVGSELGQGIRAFRKGLQGEGEQSSIEKSELPENKLEEPADNSRSSQP